MWTPFPAKKNASEAARQTSWSGVYYDGQTSRRHPVTVMLLPTGMELHLDDGDRLWWRYEEIRRTQGFHRNEPVRLERGGPLPEAVVVEDPDVLLALCRIAPTHAYRFRPPLERAAAIRRILIALAVSVGLIAVLVAWGIPLLSELVTPVIPPSWEIKLGESLAAHLADPGHRCTNAQLKESLATLVDRLSASADAHPYPLQVQVVDSAIFNAFAAPGGLIVIHRPLLQATETPEQLAGVLAHELQHVFRRHALKALARDLSIAFLVSAAFGDVSGIGAFAAQGARTVTTLHYSREIEEEADREGLHLMQAARLDPSAMVRFFEILQARTGHEELPGYLSTHPQTDERIGRLKRLINNTSVNMSPALPGLEWTQIKSLCH